jgi:uncharacterized protein (DUF1330 family)
MSCYFIANININDCELYNKYLSKAGSIFEKFNGKYLAVDNNPLVMEGNHTYARLVVIEFPDKDAFYVWYNSDAYQEILKYRTEAAECDAVLVQGL